VFRCCLCGRGSHSQGKETYLLLRLAHLLLRLTSLLQFRLHLRGRRRGIFVFLRTGVSDLRLRGCRFRLYCCCRLLRRGRLDVSTARGRLRLCWVAFSFDFRARRFEARGPLQFSRGDHPCVDAHAAECGDSEKCRHERGQAEERLARRHD